MDTNKIEHTKIKRISGKNEKLNIAYRLICLVVLIQMQFKTVEIRVCIRATLRSP